MALEENLLPFCEFHESIAWLTEFTQKQADLIELCTPYALYLRGEGQMCLHT